MFAPDYKERQSLLNRETEEEAKLETRDEPFKKLAKEDSGTPVGEDIE